MLIIFPLIIYFSKGSLRRVRELLFEYYGKVRFNLVRHAIRVVKKKQPYIARLFFSCGISEQKATFDIDVYS